MSEEPAASAPPPASGPPPAYFLLTNAVNAEANRRLRQASLLPVIAGLVAAFALGGSILPTEVTTNVLVGYLVFLGVFGTVLVLVLLRLTGGDYGAAVSMGLAVQKATVAERERAVGTPDEPPRTAEAARAWLDAHPDRPEIRPQRLAAQLVAGDVAGARQSLEGYARDTAFQRYWYEADRWTIDFVEGDIRDLGPIDAEVAAIDDPQLRAHGETGTAVLRAYAAVAAGQDWIPPMAAVHARWPAFADWSWRTPTIVRIWTLHMIIVTALIGLALLVARVTGLWPGPDPGTLR